MGKLKPLKVTKRRCGWQKRLKKKTDVASQKPSEKNVFKRE